MNGEKDLNLLLRTMTPELNEGEYVFCTVPDLSEIDSSKIIGLFKEKEGTTIILDRQTADLWKLPYHFVAKWITLTVHSSLEAVGLTAAFSNALAEAGISCNVIAAYFHDHIFVPEKDADKAMEALRKLSVSF